MVERVVVPVIENKGEASRLSPHFGRAPFFAIADFSAEGQEKTLTFQSNQSTHFGGQGRPPTQILSFQPHVIITFGMGPRALSIFQEAGVAVMRATSDTLGQVLTAFVRNELLELTEGCRDARHK